MRLILLRHGKAEERTDDRLDDQRRLTSKGRTQLEQSLPAMAHYLSAAENTLIWTSPKARAVETADILVRYMPGQRAEVHDFIATGDDEALLHALSTMQKNATLVIVGHEPHLSHWIQRLTGRETFLKKGTFMMIYLTPKNPEKAILLTRPELNQLDYLAPLAQPLPIGMTDILARQQERILLMRDHFMGDPDDPQTLHMLRVNLHIQRSLMTFLLPHSSEKRYRKADQAYAALYNELTHLREVDDLMESIHRSRDWQLEPLTSMLHNERNSEALRLNTELSTPESIQAYSDAFFLAKNIILDIEDNKSLHKHVPTQMQSLFKHICATLPDMKHEHWKELRSIRENCKSYCYLYERFAAVANYKSARQYLDMRRMHQLLGSYCATHDSELALEKLVKDNDDPAIQKAARHYAKQQKTVRALLFERLKQHSRTLIKYD